MIDRIPSPAHSILKARLLMLCALCAVSSLHGAVNVSVTDSFGAPDNDGTSNGDAGSAAPTAINGSSATLSTLGESAEVGYRFTAFNSGRGAYRFSGYSTQSITQTITAAVTWTVSADAGETYSVSLAPELHAYLNTLDGAGDESQDQTYLSNFSATLLQNASGISDSLDLTGGSQNVAGSKNVDDTAAQLFTDLTGTNTFTLTYAASTIARWKTSFGNNRTNNAVLFGQDGTMDGGEYSAGFDNYSSSAARDADGLFLPGTVTITAVPEPMTSGLILGTLALGYVVRRKKIKQSVLSFSNK